MFSNLLAGILFLFGVATVGASLRSIWPDHGRFRRSAKPFRTADSKGDLVPADYSIFETPTLGSGATQVNVSVVLMNIRDVNEKQEEITLEMNLRVFWEDKRLSHLADDLGNFTYIVLSPSLLEEIWHPDIFIDHSVSISQPAIISAPASLRIYSGSMVRYSARLTATIACKMDFHFYPSDTQKCRIHFLSYAYRNDMMKLSWRESGAVSARDFMLANFEASLEKTGNFTINTLSGKKYDVLELVISLQRKLSHHLIQTYSPSTIVLVLSWLTFLIPDDNVPERIGGCMMLLLTLTFMYSSIGENMPKVSYMTAVDAWMVTSIIFVFIILIEFMIALKLWSMAKKEKERCAVEHENHHRQDRENAISKPKRLKKSLSILESDVKVERLFGVAKALENRTFIILPILFLVFNVIYWPWLIHSAESYNN